MSFTPRTSDKVPNDIATNVYYTQYDHNHYASSGLSPLVTPSITGNCTWYAFGRAGEIANKNIQYESGNEFMTRGPNATNWLNNAASKGAWECIGYTGTGDPRNSAQSGTLINLKVGDILCYYGGSDGSGHVEVVENVTGRMISVSYSAYGHVYFDTYQATPERFKVGGTPSIYNNIYFQGVIRNPYADGGGPTPPPTPAGDDMQTYCAFALKKRRTRRSVRIRF